MVNPLLRDEIALYEETGFPSFMEKSQDPCKLETPVISKLLIC